MAEAVALPTQALAGLAPRERAIYWLLQLEERYELAVLMMLRRDTTPDAAMQKQVDLCVAALRACEAEHIEIRRMRSEILLKAALWYERN